MIEYANLKNILCNSVSNELETFGNIDWDCVPCASNILYTRHDGKTLRFGEHGRRVHKMLTSEFDEITESTLNYVCEQVRTAFFEEDLDEEV